MTTAQRGLLPAGIRRRGMVNVGPIERWLSVGGGLGLALAGLGRGSAGGISLATAGGYLVYRGLSGHCAVYQALGISRTASGEIEVERVMTVDRPPADLYRHWRRFENLPGFMEHLESVTELDEKRSRWVAKAPLGARVHWEAEVTEDRQDDRIAWRSLPGAEIENSGWVSFTPAPAARGTEVRVRLEYRPPGGSAGAALAKLLGEEPEIQVQEDLRRFKAIMETGEAPSVEGQSSGRAPNKDHKRRTPARDQEVSA